MFGILLLDLKLVTRTTLFYILTFIKLRKNQKNISLNYGLTKTKLLLKKTPYSKFSDQIFLSEQVYIDLKINTILKPIALL